MAETSKIREVALKYCQGCGVDVGCGDDKIRPEAFGIDSGLDAIYGRSVEFRNLSIVNVKQEVHDLGFIQEGSLDYVYTSHFLEHLHEPKEMIEDMCRVLKVGGHIVVYLPDRLLYTDDNPEHYHMWTAQEFVDQMVPSGMEVAERIDKHEDYSFFVVMVKKS